MKVLSTGSSSVLGCHKRFRDPTPISLRPEEVLWVIWIMLYDLLRPLAVNLVLPVVHPCTARDEAPG